MPTIMFSSSSYRVLFQSFFPQNISLLPKIVTEARANFKKKKTSCDTTLNWSILQSWSSCDRRFFHFEKNLRLNGNSVLDSR